MRNTFLPRACKCHLIVTQIGAIPRLDLNSGFLDGSFRGFYRGKLPVACHLTSDNLNLAVDHAKVYSFIQATPKTLCCDVLSSNQAGIRLRAQGLPLNDRGLL